MDDTGAVFEAIVLASPGGLGSAGDARRRETPKVDLLEAMREAAGRDRIARQYVTRFDDVFGIGLPALEAALSRGESGMWPTVFAYMAFLAGFPDSHVARKHGDEIASRVREEAAAVTRVARRSRRRGGAHRPAYGVRPAAEGARRSIPAPRPI